MAEIVLYLIMAEIESMVARGPNLSLMLPILYSSRRSLKGNKWMEENPDQPSRYRPNPKNQHFG